jgi:predicted membrane protein
MEDPMEEQKKLRLNAKIVIGLIILIFGIMLLLENLDVDLKFDPLDYWPLILIVIGLSQLLQPRESRRYFGGFILLIIGGLFLANNLIESFHFEIGQLWPLVIVFIGFRILTHGFWRSKKEPIGEDHINLAAILGGGEFNYSNKKLKGGKLTAIMGGCTVDLRDADFIEDVIMLDTFAFWGGIEIRVPQNRFQR